MKTRMTQGLIRSARKIALFGILIIGMGTYVRMNAEQRDCNLDEYWVCAVDICAGAPDVCVIGNSGNMYCVC